MPPRALPPTILSLSGVTLPKPSLRDSVLVIIDAQNEYLDGALPLARMDEAISATARLLSAARTCGAPVIHVVQHSPGRPIFIPGSRAAAIVTQVSPRADEPIIVKRLPNAFAGTDLRKTLAVLGDPPLVLAGFMTHGCVSATARAALDFGLSTTIVAAATATRDLPDPLGGPPIPAATVQAAELAALADRVCLVVPDADALLEDEPTAQ